MEFLQRITDFLNEIGIPTRRGEIPDTSFLPGVTIEKGGIVYSEDKPLSPGDLLHEAGHIAVTAPGDRGSLSGKASDDPATEMAAIAWSYAAAVHIDLPLEVLFHPDGYKGDAQSLIENFGSGRYFGVPMLQLWGMCFEGDDPEKDYPNMVRWLRADESISTTSDTPEAPVAIETRDRIRLPFMFAADRLQADLLLAQSLSEGWIRHFVDSNYSGDWSVIALRSQSGMQTGVQAIYSDPTATLFEDTEVLRGCPYFQEVLRYFHCPVRSVRLMKLAPGSRIKEHRDYDLDLEEGNARIHVPIRTNAGVEFILNGSRIDMKVGECWYLRLSDPHEVSNGGDTDRVHLVIDVGSNSWLRTQVAE